MHVSGRHGAALLLCGGVLLAPLLMIQSQPEASATPSDRGHGATGAAADPARPVARTDRLTSDLRPKVEGRRRARHAGGTPRVAPGPGPNHAPAPGAALPWTAPVETTLPSQEVAQHIATATAAPSTTVVTVPPPPPPVTTTTTTTSPARVAPVGSSGSVHYGQVTYYAHPAGTCASPFLPFGTEVEITNPATGATVSCVVNDREADTERSIDLATSTFALLAPLSQGVVDAELRW